MVGQCAGEHELGKLGEVGSYGGRREQPVTAAIAIAQPPTLMSQLPLT